MIYHYISLFYVKVNSQCGVKCFKLNRFHLQTLYSKQTLIHAAICCWKRFVCSASCMHSIEIYVIHLFVRAIFTTLQIIQLKYIHIVCANRAYKTRYSASIPSKLMDIHQH